MGIGSVGGKLPFAGYGANLKRLTWRAHPILLCETFVDADWSRRAFEGERRSRFDELAWATAIADKALVFQGTELTEDVATCGDRTRLPVPTNSTMSAAAISSTPESMKCNSLHLI